MRITYRSENTRDYWKRRWSSTDLDSFDTNEDIYPIKYANLAIGNNRGTILEAGCGAGRVVMYYHQRGFDITGFDYIEDVVANLKHAHPQLKVEFGDIYNLKYDTASFDYLLAFGLFHGLEHNLDGALRESARVLKPGGRICLSFRADNLQTLFSDYIYRLKKRQWVLRNRIFHKYNISRNELRALLTRNGFRVIEIYRAENMPFFYKFRLFRHKSHKVFDEPRARAEGYRLSKLGDFVQRTMLKLFPEQFCNLYVAIAERT